MHYNYSILNLNPYTLISTLFSIDSIYLQFYTIAFMKVCITKINLTSVKIFTPWQFSLRCYLTFGRCTCLVYLIYTNCVLTKHLDMKRTFLRIIRYCKREGSARVLIPTRQHICIDDRNDKYLLPSQCQAFEIMITFTI